MATAYLVAHFKITKKGKWKLVETGIYSESAFNLSQVYSPRRFSCDVYSAHGDEYAEAIQNLRAVEDTTHGKLIQWAFDALSERHK